MNQSLLRCKECPTSLPRRGLNSSSSVFRSYVNYSRKNPSSSNSKFQTHVVRSAQDGRMSPEMSSTGGALVRRPTFAPSSQQQPFTLNMSQVVGKQVITRTSGKDLGVVSCMWVDPKKGEVVSLDLDDKKGVGSQRVANIHISRLTQIGDVVLVHDEQVLYDQPLDGRYGFVILAGMEVRTRAGDFLGKVRDFAFSPDTGALSKVAYDDFGLSFLPVTFFDTFSLSMPDVLSIGPMTIVVADEAKYRERKETSGLFAAIPTLLRSISTSGSGRATPAGLLGTSDPYRQQQDGYLPQGYSYEQWERDVRRWEQETGLSYDQYIRSQSSRSTSRQLASVSSANSPSFNNAMGDMPPSQGNMSYRAAPTALPQQQQYQAQRPQLSTWQQQQQLQGGYPPVGPGTQQVPLPGPRQPIDPRSDPRSDPRYRSNLSSPSPAASNPLRAPRDTTGLPAGTGSSLQRQQQQQQQRAASSPPPSTSGRVSPTSTSSSSQPSSAGPDMRAGDAAPRPRVAEWLMPEESREKVLLDDAKQRQEGNGWSQPMNNVKSFMQNSSTGLDWGNESDLIRSRANGYGTQRADFSPIQGVSSSPSIAKWQ